MEEEATPVEFFQLRSGRVIMDEDMSGKMTTIKDLHPETENENDTGFERNEFGMAALFAILYKKEARYCAQQNCWYTYQDGVWKHDVAEVYVSGKLKDFVRLMILYCGEIVDDEIRDGYIKFVNRMGDRRMRDRILKDARDELSIDAAKFDADPYLINCLNGTYDLKTCTFKRHDPDDMLTMQTAFSHTVQRDVRCERWETFIDEVTEGNRGKAEYLQRALGYSMLGVANEECMFILHGKTTRNGKSTMLHVIKTMLGDYAKVAPVGLICKLNNRQSNAEAATPELVALKGRRFVTMSESNEYGKLDEEKIKQYTGGEELTGRALYQSAITFLPQFTLWLSCNDLPAVNDKSLFASNRVRVIEFNRHFNPDEQDINLKHELTQQDSMSGIFMWLIRGYLMYKQKGLGMPEDMLQVVRKYEHDNDLVLQFLEDKCVRTEGMNLKIKAVYDSYKLWCKSEGAYCCSAKKFSAEMEKHPEWTERGVSNGYRVYKGLAFKQEV